SIDQIPALKLKESPNWDSVGHITLISEIEDAFDLDLEADDMFEIDTFDSAIKVLESKYNQRF
ncbi:acyl carrier protein, partial [Parabacteroides distasonis]